MLRSEFARRLIKGPMQLVPRLAVAVAMASALALTGCPDDGGEGEGEGEEGETVIAFPNQACDVDASNPQGNCEDGYTCLPDSSGSDRGACRLTCGSLGAGGPETATKDDSITCDLGYNCVVATPLPDATPTAVVCLSRAISAGDQCFGLGDPDACPAPTSCVKAEQDNTGAPIALACYETCAVGNDTCETGNEVCLNFDEGGSYLQAGAQGAVECTPSKCDGDPGDDCECDDNYGCEVIVFTSGPENVCVEKQSICGLPIETITAAALEGTLDPETQVCNIGKGQLCDDPLVDAVEDAKVQCVTGMFSRADDGVCWALCRFPATDDNQDGDATDANEAAVEFGCPANYSCTGAISASLGFGINIDVDAGNPKAVDVGGGNFIRGCDPDLCTALEPCSDCGAGEYTCEPSESAENPFGGTCVALFGGCEPPPSAGEGEGEGAAEGEGEGAAEGEGEGATN